MARRRSKLELYLEVLKAISKGVNKPTNIMYRCNLSWANSREILKLLLKHNLINVVEENGRRIYKLTERGYEVLEHFNRAQILLALEGRRRIIA